MATASDGFGDFRVVSSVDEVLNQPRLTEMSFKLDTPQARLIAVHLLPISTALRRLNLVASAEIDETAVFSAAGLNSSLTALTVVDFHSNAASLAPFLHCTQLRNLEFICSVIMHADSIPLYRLSSLTYLNLGEVANVTIQLFEQLKQLVHLRELFLKGTKFEDSFKPAQPINSNECISFEDSIRNLTALHNLVLGGRAFAVVCPVFGRIVQKHPALRRLELFSTPVSTAYIRTLMDAVVTNKRISHLSLSTGLGDEDAEIIAAALMKGAALESLYLAGVSLTSGIFDEGCYSLANAIAHSTSLTSVRIRAMDYERDGYGSLMGALKRSPHILSAEIECPCPDSEQAIENLLAGNTTLRSLNGLSRSDPFPLERLLAGNSTLTDLDVPSTDLPFSIPRNLRALQNTRRQFVNCVILLEVHKTRNLDCRQNASLWLRFPREIREKILDHYFAMITIDLARPLSAVTRCAAFLRTAYPQLLSRTIFPNGFRIVESTERAEDQFSLRHLHVTKE